MSLTKLIEKKHIYKRRVKVKLFKNAKLKIGNSGLSSLKSQRFEFVYLRGFKKLIRRRHIRRKVTFRKKKFWIFLAPNIILSSKSTNSRMGAGVGSYVRLAINLKVGKTFIEFKNYSPYCMRKLHLRTRFRYPLSFKYIVQL